MKPYIGTKIINARPMNRLDYTKFRGWTLPADENGEDEGYLVEYTDGGKPNLPGFAGYVSWSPKEQFECAYIVIGDVSGLPPHQQRVVAEKADLDDKRTKLMAFYSSPIFHGLPESEQSRLLRQGVAMRAYSEILSDRIDWFKECAAESKTMDRIEAMFSAMKSAQIKPVQAKTVTMQGILDKIKSATYTLLPNGRTTICQLTMENGFTIEGKSACVCAETYNKALGEKYAYEDALSNVWAFEGYLLAEKLANAAKN